MKLLYLIAAASLTVQVASAQDFCKEIRKESTGNTIREFESPYKENEPPLVRVKRTISKDEDEPFDNFVLIFRTVCPVGDVYDLGGGEGQAERQEKKLAIYFDDDTSIVDDTVDVTHDLMPDHIDAIRFVFYPIIPETAESFANKKISRFVIAGQEVKMPDEASKPLMEYIRCIQKEK